MKLKFESKKFHRVSLEVIRRANAIIDEYMQQGYRQTIRQLYYQFIARNLFPDEWKVNLGGGVSTKNHERNYKKLIQLLNNGRLAGIVSWDAIEDLTRHCTTWAYDRDPASSLSNLIRDYTLDPWKGQPVLPEIWVEKEALSGVFRRVAESEGVPFFACRGYHSASSAWEARNRLLNRDMRDQKTLVLHFGDHDPSGLDMTRDIEDRFAMMGVGADALEVRRIALNMDQIRKLDPPPSPAKPGDSRTPAYEQEFQTSDTWELDAVEIRQLEKLARDEVQAVIDPVAREKVNERESRDIETLEGLLETLENRDEENE